MTDTTEKIKTEVASMPKYRWISRSAKKENDELRRYLDKKVYDKLEHALDLTERLMKDRLSNRPKSSET